MNLPGAEHGVLGAAFAGGALHMAGLEQIDGDGAGDAAEHFAPADDAGDGFLVHAVLQGHDEAVRRQVLGNHRRRPFGVVGLHADEGHVEGFCFRRLLQFGQMQRFYRGRPRFDVAQMRHFQAVGLHGLDVGGPRVDEGNVFPGPSHMGPRVGADGAGAHDGDFVTHWFPPD